MKVNHHIKIVKWYHNEEHFAGGIYCAVDIFFDGQLIKSYGGLGESLAEEFVDGIKYMLRRNDPKIKIKTFRREKIR